MKADGILDIFYALINSDREHPISWVSIENEKKREGLENEIFLIIQMSDRFSTENQEKDENFVKSQILTELNNLLPCLRNSKVIFSDLKLWRLALPKGPIENSNEEKIESSKTKIIEKPNEILNKKTDENLNEKEIKISAERSVERFNEHSIERSMNALAKMKKHGIFVIGDGVGGKGRAEGAMISGIETAEEILKIIRCHGKL